jgi:hypothetical protein
MQLLSALKGNTSLKDLCLLTPLKLDSCKLLCDALNQNTTMRTLSLGGIGAMGVSSLVDWLKQNDTLTALHLTESVLAPTLLVSFCERLKFHTSLQILHLPSNYIDEEQVHSPPLLPFH